MKTILLGILTCSLGLASTISVTLDQALQIASPGSFLTFSGTITNTGSDTVFLNGAAVALPYFELDYDLTPFFTLSPASLDVGDFYTGDLFTVAVSGAASPGDYFGSLSMQGGADSGSYDDLASESFQITVSPEPPTFMLLASVFSLLGAYAGVCKVRSVRTRNRLGGAPPPAV
jgi:hypothetical protein